MSRKLKNQNIVVGFLALGCPKNIVDSEVMLARLGEAGFVLTQSIEQADVVIVNTCGFIEPAKQEAIDELQAVCELKRQGKVKVVLAAGCLSQRLGDKLGEFLPEIDAVLGLQERDQIVSIVRRQLEKSKDRRVAKSPDSFLSPEFNATLSDSGRLLLTPRHWAYLRISDGCNRRCSFCAIPSIRGCFRSKPMDWVIAEAQELADNGAVELILIAQDTTSYGRDLVPKTNLVELLSRLDALDKLRWLRLMYLYPSSVENALIDVIAASKKMVHYIDLPIQHINNRLLKSMRRADTKENNIRLIERLRAAMPDVVLRTTCIVGYPGETEQEFQELVEFVQWAQFDALGCFPFYAEPGTAAGELDSQIPDTVKQERVERLMLAQQEIVFAKMDRWRGRQMEILVDQVDKNVAVGRFYGQAPHIDGHCIIQSRHIRPGQFIQAQVVGREGYDLIVKPIDRQAGGGLAK